MRVNLKGKSARSESTAGSDYSGSTDQWSEIGPCRTDRIPMQSECWCACAGVARWGGGGGGGSRVQFHESLVLRQRCCTVAAARASRARRTAPSRAPPPSSPPSQSDGPGTTRPATSRHVTTGSPADTGSSSPPNSITAGKPSKDHQRLRP